MTMLKEQLLIIYPDCKIYGAYIRKDGRGYFVLVKKDSYGLIHKTSKKSSIMLARAKMEVKLGRRLLTTEEVDHRDGDNTNDADGNLQVIDKEAHKAKSAVEASLKFSKRVDAVCPNCETVFKCRPFRLKNALLKGKTPCCSTSCRSSYYGANQYGNF
jgi:hypothetical protein